MKISLLILFLLLSTGSKAQFYDRVLKVLKDCHTKTEIRERISKLQQDVREERIKRPMDFNYEYSYYDFTFSSNSQYQNFRLYLFSEGDTLKFAKLEGLHWRGKVSQKDVFVKDDSSLLNFIRQHNSLYKSTINEAEFIKQITEQLTYTLGCGITGDDYSTEARKMYTYVEAGSKRKLNQWLRSCNTELQAYGATGLLMLQKKGKSLKSEEQRIIRHLGSLNPEVQLCSGCMFGLVKPFKEIMAETEVND